MLYKAAQKDDVDSFIAAMEKVMEANSLSLHNISKQKTRIGNTFLHVAVSRGNENLTSFIVFYFRDLIWVSNKRGNTAFHEASRAGHLGCLEILVRFENYDEQLNKEYDTLRSWNKSRWRSKNKVGNTSLHEAFFNNQRKVVDYLIKSRVEEAYYVNNEGKSVLYLAVEADMVDIVNSTLSNMVSDVNEKFMSLFTMGRSLINVALRRRNTVMLKELLKKLPALVHVVDEDGQNALFYAVSTGYQDGLIWLIDELKMDCSQMNSMGFFPVHVASKFGHVHILQKLIQTCPDAGGLKNRKGQNIFHVAATYGKENVVKFIFVTTLTFRLLNLLN